MTLPIPQSPNNRFLAHVEAKQFALSETRAEIDVLTQLKLGKTIGDGFQVADARRLGANWQAFLKTQENVGWVSFCEVDSLSLEFVNYLAQKFPAADAIHQQISDPRFILDVRLYCAKQINKIKLANSSYLSDKARLFGALVELVPAITEQVHQGINRNIKHFAGLREQFSYLSDVQFERFQADYTTMLKQMGPDITKAVLEEVQAMMEDARHV